MTDIVTTQLDAIHSMLAAGHRSLRIERHSLILWGLTGSALFLFGDYILTPDQIPVAEQRAAAWLILLTVVLGGVGVVDWFLTRRTKHKRDQVWSFAHRQILKVWWLLLALGTLLHFGMFFFGGRPMLMAAWLVLVGVGLYVHGLFSEELLEWAGAVMIAIGVSTLAFQLNPQTSKLIAASVFGVGFPLLAMMLDRGKAHSPWRRLRQSILWLLCVLGLPLLVDRYVFVDRYVNAVTVPEAPVVSLATYLQRSSASGPQIVSIPAGTKIPVKVEISGDLFRGGQEAVWPLVLANPIEAMTVDGQLTGEFRFAGGDWLRARDRLWIQIPSLKMQLTGEEGPVVHTSLIAKVWRRNER
jgi:hypothetical protein